MLFGGKMKKKIVPTEMLLPIFITLLCNHCAYFVSRIFTTGLEHHEVTLSWEHHIPLMPWTIIIYWGCYLFWIANYILAARRDRRTAYRFFCADVTAKLVCLFFYVVFPTTNVRPPVEGTGVFDFLMRLLYQIDAPDNLFPSIHCLTSWFCYMIVRDDKRVPKWYRGLSLIIAIAVCVSTLTTKQHAVVDVIGGVGLAELSYFLVDKIGLACRYRGALVSLRMYVRRRRLLKVKA